MTPRVVLVTGVSRFLGGATAHALAQDPRIERVIGVDITSAHPALAGHSRAEFVRADIRSPLIAKVIDSAGVDAVVHTDINASASASGGRASMKEANVMGTMRLLAACQHARLVTRLVVKSTGAVYGSSHRDPAMFTEQMQPRTLSGGYGKDAQDVEAYVRSFHRRRSDVSVTVLRFANLIGPSVDSVLAPYFAMRLVPILAGYDPRLQFVHEQDAVAALVRSATVADPVDGVFNIAAPDVMRLSQAVTRAGRLPLPVVGPAASVLGRAVRMLGFGDFTPDHIQFLRYGRAMDTSLAAERLGFRTEYSTREAFDDYLAGRGIRPTLPLRALRSALGVKR
ncbi:NAD-dependent epimerase/dehydratase family protein [Cumulibacter manganitolerans]|uniref:NAD-dependent epimerase/dehydratase family protein n=1 Tax=Cumulibacter manganitolerans TaxID=1884992 RepID=UPI0012952193|nr:NAD-dependent epimerase/dehydratase family protein [Cumulibacter manganitolerans]